MTYQTITVEPVTPHIGAEISNIDLSQPLGNQTFQEVHDALMAHQVIFFRDQDITPEQHVAFGRRFGELNIHPVAPHLEGHPEVLILHNDEKVPPSINHWHTDVTFLERPAMGSILHAVTVPAVGGDTIWASMYAAYEALSDKMQRFLSGLSALHDFEHVFFGNKLYGEDGRQVLRQGKNRPEDADDVQRLRQKHPVMEHPVLRTHPVTGKTALFVNSVFTLRIKDMKESESRALLDFLFRHIETPEFQVRFKWRKNSIAFWDNRCTQHYAVADYYPQLRHMHRVTVEGDRPFYRAA